MKFRDIVERIELPHHSRWINNDVRPIESERRTWNFLTYHNYWLLINCNIATFLTGSALIPLGLTWWQAIICIVIGNILGTTALILSSLAGAYYHIGFPVFSRAVWGIWGASFVVWNRIFLAFVWYGFQSWVGGQCLYLMLLSWDPHYEQNIPNTIPADTGMTSAQFLSYFFFCIISLPFLWIQPHRIQIFFYIASFITLAFFLVLLIWALATMGPGGFGNTITSTTDSIPATGGPKSTAWLMVFGIMSTIGSIAAGILNQNDWARFARKPSDAIWGQAFAFPLYSIFASVLGILVTAATQHRFGGEAIWNPPTLFARLLEQNSHSGSTRAAVFFAGLALVVSQIGSNLPGNAFSGGIDLSSVLPRFINIRRGAYIVAILSPIVNPWRLVNTATTFLVVLSSYSMFLAPMTGIMASQYMLVGIQKLNVDDLFCGNEGSVYWYTKGINWRAPLAWLVGVVPCLPGFVAAVDPSVSVSDSVTELYYTNYMYGFLSSALVYWLLHWAFSDLNSGAFVRNSPSARELQELYLNRWDVSLGETPELLDKPAIIAQDGKKPLEKVSSLPV